MRTALTIAGSDSGGGAGIQADLKTFSAHDVFGTSAVTAITAQNTLGVQAWEAVSTRLVIQQIESVLGDIGAGAVKIGMLANAEIVSAVARTLSALTGSPVVLDPVMIAKGGDRLLEEAAVSAMKLELLGLAHLVTPNIPEAEVLADMPIRSAGDMLRAGERIRKLGATVVLVKGGHADGPESIDVAVTEQGSFEVRGPRLPGRHTHGTGCTLSSALAAGLARGRDVIAAAQDAKAYVTAAIAAADALQVGHGHGPLDHFPSQGRTS
jgi:hydroxymethylpyrimidine/phosphomethylpyrimidine kinase